MIGGGAPIEFAVENGDHPDVILRERGRVDGAR